MAVEVPHRLWPIQTHIHFCASVGFSFSHSLLFLPLFASLCSPLLLLFFFPVRAGFAHLFNSSPSDRVIAKVHLERKKNLAPYIIPSPPCSAQHDPFCLFRLSRTLSFITCVSSVTPRRARGHVYPPRSHVFVTVGFAFRLALHQLDTHGSSSAAFHSLTHTASQTSVTGSPTSPARCRLCCLLLPFEESSYSTHPSPDSQPSRGPHSYFFASFIASHSLSSSLLSSHGPAGVCCPPPSGQVGWSTLAFLHAISPGHCRTGRERRGPHGNFG